MKKNWFLTDEKSSYVLGFFVFYSAWLLAFPFYGQLQMGLYDLFESSDVNVSLIAVTAQFLGLLFSGFFVNSLKRARSVILLTTVFSALGTIVFFWSYTILWDIVLIAVSFVAGLYVASWGHLCKAYTTPQNRVVVIAFALIYSNVLMLLINVSAVNISLYLGLVFAILCLLISLFLFSRAPLPLEVAPIILKSDPKTVRRVIRVLYLFIMILTITAGLMYEVINPMFAHHTSFVSWYWAVPYIVAILFLVRTTSKVNKAYVLYIAIALIGFSFLSFMILNQSLGSYFIVNSMMMFAFGVCDLFWWSIIGELFDYVENPAHLMGVCLSANILGIMVGGALGRSFVSMEWIDSPSLVAMIVVFLVLIMLPFLNKELSSVIRQHIFLVRFERIDHSEPENHFVLPELTARESEIVELLMTGRTYKMIAEELFLSENTIKTHIKNIYSKYEVQSKTELIKIISITRKG
ncbi:MAG: LuxR C-terminal-related transcriptional regulator [Bacillota bacterium]|nr:LuxR C-terminal-related transcriptional regulator [Bacillota bacterium]